jgi:hypothetical protein
VWREPDPAEVDAVLRVAMFAADDAALSPGPPSRIRNPDGSPQSETGHERTQRIVRAALRMVLANGLVRAVPHDEWPEYTQMNPPEVAQ